MYVFHHVPLIIVQQCRIYSQSMRDFTTMESWHGSLVLLLIFTHGCIILIDYVKLDQC